MIATIKKLKENRSGVVLVMALIMASLMLASVLILTTALSQEVKVSLNTNNAVVSYYTAETGIEKSLHRIKYSRLNGDFDVYQELENFGTDDIGGGRAFTIASSTVSSIDFTRYSVTPNTPASLDIVSPSGDLGLIDLGSASYYVVTWEIDQCFSEHSGDKLEIRATTFDQNFSNPQTSVDLAVCDCGYGNDNCSTVGTTHNILTDRYYRFSFRPLDDTVDKLTFSLYDSMGQKVGILSEATIKVNGTYAKSQYHLEARVPSLSQLSDVFSFVIFSEESLIKDIP